MNTSKSFVKQNLVLVVGLTLPLLLIVLFFMATVLPKKFGAPPQYDLLYTATKYDYQNQQKYNLKFFVEGGVLKALIVKNGNDNNYNAQQLMRFTAKDERVTPINVDVSKLNDVKDGTVIVIAETKSLKIDSASIAPDGYILDSPSYNGGLVTGMFGGYRQGGYRIKKGAVAYKIPITQPDYYYTNMQFVGWVVGGN